MTESLFSIFVFFFFFFFFLGDEVVSFEGILVLLESISQEWLLDWMGMVVVAS